MTAVLWTLELQTAVRRGRVALFSAAVPLLLVAALALGRAPAPHAALVYTVLFTFFGTFGAAVPWARDAERGWLHRLVLTGTGMPGDRGAAHRGGGADRPGRAAAVAAGDRAGVSHVARRAGGDARHRRGGAPVRQRPRRAGRDAAASLAETALLASVTAPAAAARGPACSARPSLAASRRDPARDPLSLHARRDSGGRRGIAELVVAQFHGNSATPPLALSI